MRPDQYQDPHPEFGIPAPRDPADPSSAPLPGIEPRSGAGTASHPRPTSARFAERTPAGQPVRTRQSAARGDGERQHAAPAAGAPRGWNDPPGGHPSGPLPVGATRHRRGGVARPRRALLALVVALATLAGAAGYAALSHWRASNLAVAQVAGAPEPGAPVAGSALTGPHLGTRQTPLGLVATSDGFTVYQFTKDSTKPSASTCTGTCAATWPPVLATDAPWLKGVPSTKVGTVTRPDGTTQLTLNGWPLYRYVHDSAPGDTAGNGVGGTWHAVNPTGTPVAPTASTGGTGPGAVSRDAGATPGSPDARGGYGSPSTIAPAPPAPPAAPAADPAASSGY